jgi:hypothetical protein
MTMTHVQNPFRKPLAPASGERGWGPHPNPSPPKRGRGEPSGTDSQFGRALSYLLGSLGLLTLAGCGGLKLYPVSGTVTLDGQPLSQSTVSFNPDTSKGNNHTVSCVGRLDGQGGFKLQTIAVRGSEGGPGAPLGWYKVTLLTGLPGDPEIKVKPIYLDPNKSPISIEVVEKPEPGRYDLKFTK